MTNLQDLIKLRKGMTQGEWFIDGCDSDKCVIAARDKDDSLLEIAHVFQGEDYSEKESEAIAALPDILDQLIAELEWVPVRARLPKRDRGVLLFGDGIMETGYCAIGTDIFYSDSGDLKHGLVTHWKPLPSPPKGEG